MKIVWTHFAIETLKEIFDYYKDIAGKDIAHKINAQIFKSTNQLKKHPNSGQIETSLEQLGEEHRYLVSGNYKIIYRKVKEGILIIDVFDTRQDPIKINDPMRKPSLE